MAQAFIPNPEGLDTVNHKDEDKTNNDVSNLEWMGLKENINYGTGVQRSAASRGKPVYCLELDKTFPSISEAAREIGVNYMNVWMCLNGRQKTCGGYRWKYAQPELEAAAL